MKKLIILGMLFMSLSLLGQEKKEITASDYQNSEVEMADQFRADGKIYVVVAVVVIILSGLLVYAMTIDRKVSRIEKSFEEKLN